MQEQQKSDSHLQSKTVRISSCTVIMASLRENGSMRGKTIKICQKRIVLALTVNIFPISFQ